MLQGLGSWRPRATASQAGGFGPQTLKGFDQILAAKASQDWAEAEKFLLTPPPRDEAQGGGGLLGVWGRGETVSSTPAPPPVLRPTSLPGGHAPSWEQPGLLCTVCVFGPRTGLLTGSRALRAALPAPDASFAVTPSTAPRQSAVLYLPS